MSLITFDWSQIAYIGSPLATPWWAEANIAVGFVFFFWILVPVLYYSVRKQNYFEVLTLNFCHRMSGFHNICQLALVTRLTILARRTMSPGSSTMIRQSTLRNTTITAHCSCLRLLQSPCVLFLFYTHHLSDVVLVWLELCFDYGNAYAHLPLLPQTNMEASETLYA